MVGDCFPPRKEGGRVGKFFDYEDVTQGHVLGHGIPGSACACGYAREARYGREIFARSAKISCCREAAQSKWFRRLVFCCREAAKSIITWLPIASDFCSQNLRADAQAPVCYGCLWLLWCYFPAVQTFFLREAQKKFAAAKRPKVSDSADSFWKFSRAVREFLVPRSGQKISGKQYFRSLVFVFRVETQYFRSFVLKFGMEMQYFLCLFFEI